MAIESRSKMGQRRETGPLVTMGSTGYLTAIGWLLDRGFRSVGVFRRGLRGLRGAAILAGEYVLLGSSRRVWHRALHSNGAPDVSLAAIHAERSGARLAGVIVHRRKSDARALPRHSPVADGARYHRRHRAPGPAAALRPDQGSRLSLLPRCTSDRRPEVRRQANGDGGFVYFECLVCLLTMRDQGERPGR